jgi:hypothetical protein
MDVFKLHFRSLGSFHDGSLIANNPTLDTLTEIHNYNIVCYHPGVRSGISPTLILFLGTRRKTMKLTETEKNKIKKLRLLAYFDIFCTTFFRSEWVIDIYSNFI